MEGESQFANTPMWNWDIDHPAHKKSGSLLPEKGQPDFG